MWERVDTLLVAAPSPAAAHHHHVGALVARARRARGLDVAPELRAAEQATAMSALTAPILLRRVRAAAPGLLLTIKGAEAAAAYARPEARPFKDVDLVCDDVAGTVTALRAAGFQDVDGVSVPEHHARPLIWPGIPLAVEIHDGLRRVDGLGAPGLAELREFAVPSRTGVAGVLGLEPSAHAVLLAQHAWSHGPLSRLGPLIDVAAALAGGDRGRATAIARAWGYARLWRTTLAVIDELLGDGTPTLATATWARHLREVREPTVLEGHAARIASEAWGQSGIGGARQVLRAALGTARSVEDDTWAQRARRARRALGHASMPLSDYQILP